MGRRVDALIGMVLLLAACGMPTPGGPLTTPSATSVAPAPTPQASPPTPPTPDVQASVAAGVAATLTARPPAPTPPTPLTTPTALVVPRPASPSLPAGPPIAPTPVPPTPYADAAVGLGQPFALRPGQAITVQGSDLRLEFRAIAEDSRCPQTVNCVWAGRAVVTLAATHPSQPAASLSVATCCPEAESSRARYAGHELRLLRVLPYPLRHDTVIRPEEYVVELIVTRPGNGAGAPAWADAVREPDRALPRVRSRRIAAPPAPAAPAAGHPSHRRSFRARPISTTGSPVHADAPEPRPLATSAWR
jgi:hypothetical protein